jgi:hypothetical protein
MSIGIFGLSLLVERGHKSDIFEHLCKANPHLRPVFSLYFSSHQDILASAVTFGGADKSRTGNHWQHVKIIPYPYLYKYAYWAVKLVSFVVVRSGGNNGAHEGGGVDGEVSPGSTNGGYERSSNYCDREVPCRPARYYNEIFADFLL